MNNHFQYAELDPKQLYQGDILVRTDKLENVLEGIYPYAYSEKEKYKHFIILTQSCDLIRRNSTSPKADQITIAAVRSIRHFLNVEVAKLQKYPTLKKVGICIADKKIKILQMIERLISNDEDPYFYLHPGPETPYNDPMVAYLRITFPLRLAEHYETCRNAKVVQLDPIFQAKLGWLTTLVFGQVGTIDFDPKTRGKFAKQYLSAYNDVRWIKRGALVSGAKKEGKEANLNKIREDDLKAILELFSEISYQEIIADRIIQIAESIFKFEKEDINKFRGKLLKDSEIMSAFVK